MRTIVVLLFFVSLSATLTAQNQPSPNIVLMMADDMGMGDTSAYQDFTGNSDTDQIHTPNMERLARMGVRFTDAHTPSSRCSPTRYALLTGRYPWRNRLKHWVLFGVQGDPMIERDRPTLGTLMKDNGYRTALVGKWHVGLRYRQRDGRPAAGWDDADLTQPMFDTPLDHGFDQCWFTSRSHGTSGPAVDGKKTPNNARQSVGPGHIHGRKVIAATHDGKRLHDSGDDAYVLHELGGRHSDHAIEFLTQHLPGNESADQPFFLYYPSNSNHGPYTPDTDIDAVPVKGAAKNVAGDPLDVRSDYVYENDVALGRLIDFLQTHNDSRRPGEKLIDNTIVIFTSDNGAEKNSNVATGPFRSHKGSAYEGGHRVPFMVTWPLGGVGDGDSSTAGKTSDALIGLHDLFATFADVLGSRLPDPLAGQKGAEDSVSVLAAWRGERSQSHPMFFHDHKEAKDHAASVFRLDDPTIGLLTKSGKWKLFFDGSLLRKGTAKPIELYDLATDPRESTNLIGSRDLESLIDELSLQAIYHRTAGGHRLNPVSDFRRVAMHWGEQAKVPFAINIDATDQFAGAKCSGVTSVVGQEPEARVTIFASDGKNILTDRLFNVNARGLGVDGGQVGQVDEGETIVIEFDRDVIVESVSIVAGNGVCGGYYQVGDHSPLAIYCVDADIDAQDQSGILSDIGVVKVGQSLRLSSSPHYGVEAPGKWRLGGLNFRVIKQ